MRTEGKEIVADLRVPMKSDSVPGAWRAAGEKHRCTVTVCDSQVAAKSWERKGGQ